MTILASSSAVKVTGGVPMTVIKPYQAQYTGMFVNVFMSRKTLPAGDVTLEALASFDGGQTYQVQDSITTQHFDNGGLLEARASVGMGFAADNMPSFIGLRASALMDFTPDLTFKVD